MSSSGRIRLFIALPVPLEVAHTLITLVPPELDGLKRVGPELLHITLAFIGWIDQTAVDDVTDAVRRAVAGRSPFTVSLDEVGRFPPTGRPRVLWIGSEEATPLIEELATAVRNGLTSAGIPFDRKPLRPHVTLARARDDIGPEAARALAAAARTARVPAGARFEADGVHVMQSTLTPRGPRYASRSVVRLGLPNGRA